MHGCSACEMHGIMQTERKEEQGKCGSEFEVSTLVIARSAEVAKGIVLLYTKCICCLEHVLNQA